MQCNEAQSKIALFLEDALTLEQKSELACHIRGCSHCREELEFYYAVYDTIGKFDDLMLSGDYAEHAEELLCQTEKEQQSARKVFRWRRFRLVTACFLLTLGMSLGVRGNIIGENPVQMISEPFLCMDGMELPGELALVQNAIKNLDKETREFVSMQRMHAMMRQAMCEQDVAVQRILKKGSTMSPDAP